MLRNGVALGPSTPNESEKQSNFSHVHVHPVRCHSNLTFLSLSLGHFVCHLYPLWSAISSEMGFSSSNGVKVADYHNFPPLSRTRRCGANQATSLSLARSPVHGQVDRFNGNKFLFILNQVKVTVTEESWGMAYIEMVLDGSIHK